MVELQIVVLAVAGSSPVGHPPTGRERSSTPRALALRRAKGLFRRAGRRRDNPVGHPPTGRERSSTPCALALRRAKGLFRRAGRRRDNPVGHPPTGRERSSTPRALALRRAKGHSRRARRRRDSPVGHPSADGTRTQFDYPRVSASPSEATFVELAVGEIIPSVTPSLSRAKTL